MPKTENLPALAPDAMEGMFQKCRDKYWYYVWYTHNAPDAIYGLVPQRWVPAKAPLFVCTRVQEFIERPGRGAYEILLISEPPQHGKSQSVTETLPSWYIGKHPEHNIILVSYNDETVEPFMRKNIEKIDAYCEPIFGIKIGDVRRANEIVLTNKRGGIISRGIQSGITSRPANLIIVDDPIKNREQAESELERAKIWAEWCDTISSRMAAHSKIIVIQTRWHEDDLTGRILKNEKPSKITRINLPCEAEERDLLGRKPGEPLCPEFGKDAEWLDDVKYKYFNAIDMRLGEGGAMSWYALYQGRPTAAEGNLIKRHWWRYWKRPGDQVAPVRAKDEDGKYVEIQAEDLPAWHDEEVQSWDCAFKDTVGCDRVSGGLWMRNAARVFALDNDTGLKDIIATMQAITDMSKKWPKALSKYVEGKANGSAVIQLMRRKLFGMIEVEPEGGKIDRVQAILGAIKAGNVYLPHPSYYPWVAPFIDECAAFPSREKDDQVDQMSQALVKIIYRESSRDPARKPMRDTSLEGREAQRLERIEREYRFGKKPRYV